MTSPQRPPAPCTVEPGPHLEELGVDVGGHCTGQQRLAGAGRPVEQTALGRLDADAEEELGVLQRQLNHLAQLADLLAEAADSRVRHVAGVLLRHLVHDGIHLARQHAV